MTISDKSRQDKMSQIGNVATIIKHQKTPVFAMSMLKQFLLIYVGFIAVFFTYIDLVRPMLLSVYEAEVMEDQNRDWQGVFLLLDASSQRHSPSEWKNLLQQINKVSNIPVEVNHIDNWGLSETAINTLHSGRIWIEDLSEGEPVFGLISDNLVVRLGPVASTDSALIVYNMIHYAPLIMIAVCILFWVCWLQYRLFRLEKATLSYSLGDFDARAPESYLAVGNVNAAFNNMAEHVKRFFISQKHLTNAVSHELRSPIGRLKFQLEMLSESTNHQDRERYQHGMSEDIDELEQMVDEMLTYAKMESSEPQVLFESLDIGQWLVQQKQHLCHDINIAISINIPEKALNIGADQVLLSRLLRNLVCNASHYGGDKVVIGYELNGNHCCLYVDDNGSGIPQKYRESIFEPFTRLDPSRNKNTGGYGLGLAIVAQIARYHSGYMEIQDSPNGGASMRFNWPLN